LLDLMRKIKRRVFPPTVQILPVEGRHVLPSAIVSADDEISKPSDRLIDLALLATQNARSISMNEVSRRMKTEPYFPEVWPGEHYKFLAGLVKALQPKTVVEIGTSSGLSALALVNQLPKGGRVITFDVISWKEFSDTVLTDEDFQDGTLQQILGDLAIPEIFSQNRNLLQEADLIFCDGPKDGKFEQLFLDLMFRTDLPQKPIVVFDDIRLMNMLRIWRNISLPKLDVTSFGHWSGTGLVDWQP